MLPSSLLLLVLLGLWIRWHRRSDPWLLFGVTAIVARLWTDHQLFDDLLILVPLVTLFRLLKMGKVSYAS